MGKKKSNKAKSENKLPEWFNKYEYYEKAVQNTDHELEFLNKVYKKKFKKDAKVLREDFCGTGMLACEWVKQSKKHTAFGIDLSAEPIEYGKENHYSKLSKDEQKRMVYHEKNVLDCAGMKADIIVAFNFSYFIFKERKQLLDYFKSIRKSMKKDSVFLIDLFGGPDCQVLQEEETDYGKFSYYWDLDHFNPITNEVTYYIHFKPKGKKKIREVFTYEWRHWGLPELIDLLHEAGFAKTVPYWEGDDGDGGGDGDFYEATESEENCESWVTYISAYA